MSLQQLRKQIQELKEEAAKRPNIEPRESLKEHTERLQTSMQGYTDAGVFGEGDHLKINVVCDSDLPGDLIQRWENRDLLTIDEFTQLYREMGIFE